MRTLKFRAWDTVLKRWNYSIEIDCYGRLQEYKWNGSAFYAKYKNDYEENYEDVSNRFIICQFTGLLDTTGKEVYEGDILKSDWGYDGIVDLESLVFAKIECRLSDNIEVIGNIYENPELLTKQ